MTNLSGILPVVLVCIALPFACNSPDGGPDRELPGIAESLTAPEAVDKKDIERTSGEPGGEQALSLPVANPEPLPEDRPRSAEEPRSIDLSTIRSRFSPPPGYQRQQAAPASFAAYLQELPLKPGGTEVRYYNGRIKENRGVYIAVVDIDVGTRDLQQCADAVMRLRAEHLWAQQDYDAIHFNFTNGFRTDYQKWREGYRIKIEGNETSWHKAAGRDTSYRSFRRYMDLVFAYASTWSLSRELRKVDISDMQIGDVFIQGGSPGHAVIVVDMAVQPGTGRKVFLLAQSYMPAQDIQILQNPVNDALNPWYELDFGETLNTPEWRFRAGDLMRFP